MPRARMSAEVKRRLLEAGRATADMTSRGDGRAVVVDRVRAWIFDGLLRDGDVISQEDLGDVLGLSRIPVRDGLIALAGSGWVVMDPGVGTRVVGLDAAAVRDSMELFGDIWALLIRRAVERAGDATAVVAAGERVGAATSPQEMTAANEEFVEALRDLAAAPRLNAAFANAGRIVAGDFFAVVPDAEAVQRRHVPAIGAAIGEGDVERGALATRAQHRAHAQNVVRLLRERGVVA